MEDYLNSSTTDVIDLRELFMSLWTYKIIITCVCAFSIMFSGYYALTLDKEFTSVATFNLDVSKPNKFSLGNSQLDVLASLSGVRGATSGAELIETRVKGRIFIEKLDAKLNFQGDQYFNSISFNSRTAEPIWKSMIKRAIGWEKSSIDAHEAIWQGIASKYYKSVVVKETKSGALQVSATHVSAVRAAEIANVITEEIISGTKKMTDTQQDKQLYYLSNTLAKAQGDLEIAQSNLKTFALQNSALPLENFSMESLKLDELREKLGRTTELHEAVAGMLLMLNNKTIDQANYLLLRKKFPIVDQVEFRRVLGQNEIISSWSWPPISTVNTVFDTLSERKSRLQAQIEASQIGAERSGQALEVYARLEREAKIAEATYTVLIEQVKAQSMLAGYRPNKSEIFEHASPSITPSAPRRNVIIALGGILGLFLGSALALVLAFFRCVYHSRKSLIASARAHFEMRSKTLISLRNKNLNETYLGITKKQRPVLRDIAVEIHKCGTNQAIVTSSCSKMIAIELAQAIALTMQSETTKIALINFSSKSKKLNIDVKQASNGSYDLDVSEGYVSVLKPIGNLPAMELISQKDFLKNIQLLNSNFDLIFLCADNDDAISLLRALEGQKMFHLMMARTRRTKKYTLQSICSLFPIQGLLYD